MNNLDQYIENLPTSKWTMTVEQRTCLKDFVSRRAPCNFLVWGVGFDSELWCRCNCGGTTIFIEDNAKWIDRIKAKYDVLDIVQIRYTTRRWRWRRLLDQPNKLELALPDRIVQNKWDVIFVDAPAGWAAWHPGRMQSIYASHRLAADHDDVDVFVHDMNRPVEKNYANRFLGSHNLVMTLGNLAHYSISSTND